MEYRTIITYCKSDISEFFSCNVGHGIVVEAYFCDDTVYNWHSC